MATLKTENHFAATGAQEIEIVSNYLSRNQMIRHVNSRFVDFPTAIFESCFATQLHWRSSGLVPHQFAHPFHSCYVNKGNCP
jgi:hypothetical protein